MPWPAPACAAAALLLRCCTGACKQAWATVDDARHDQDDVATAAHWLKRSATTRSLHKGFLLGAMRLCFCRHHHPCNLALELLAHNHFEFWMRSRCPLAAPVSPGTFTPHWPPAAPTPREPIPVALDGLGGLPSLRAHNARLGRSNSPLGPIACEGCSTAHLACGRDDSSLSRPSALRRCLLHYPSRPYHRPVDPSHASLARSTVPWPARMRYGTAAYAVRANPLHRRTFEDRQSHRRAETRSVGTTTGCADGCACPQREAEEPSHDAALLGWTQHRSHLCPP